MIRVIAWAIILLALFKWATAHASVFPSQYDSMIQSSVKKWWLDYPDWMDWKAQLYQESKLDPNAVSPVGAEGLAQFMPKTWSDIERQLGYGTVSRKLAGPAIEGGAYYMAGLRRSWSAPRPMDDRQRIAQASYNGGTGSLLKAQRLCQATLWEDIAPCLPMVTGFDNARQTVNYVSMIAKWRGTMR